MTPLEMQILKFKSHGWSSKRIAQRVGLAEDKVEEIFKAVVGDVQNDLQNGFSNLVEKFTQTCAQYQTLGESLKALSKTLCEHMTAEEIRKLCTADPAETAQNIAKNAIVLRPFILKAEETDEEDTDPRKN